MPIDFIWLILYISPVTLVIIYPLLQHQCQSFLGGIAITIREVNMDKLKAAWRKFWEPNPDYDVQNRELVNFGIGVAGQNHDYNLVSGWFEYFCNMILLINPMTTGIILGISRAWDAINDPLAGSIIDKHVFKSGDKLRPYIRMMAFPIGIFTALMFTNFGFTKEGARVCYVMAMYLMWDTCYSFQDVAQWGMVARITNSPSRREKAAYAGRVGGMVGGWLPGLISVFVGFCVDGILPITTGQLFIFLGLLFGIGGMAMSLVQLKCVERAPVKPPEGGLIAGFKLLRHNKIIIYLCIAQLLNSCTLVVQGTYFFQYMVSLNIAGKPLSGLYLLTIFGFVTGLPGTIAMLFTPQFAKKIGGMQRVLILAAVTNLVLRAIAGIVGYQGYRIIFLCFAMIIIGIPNSMMGIAQTSLWGDSIDYVEWKTGKRNEGATFAMQNFLAKMTSSIGSILSGVTLTLLHFAPEVMKRSSASVEGVMMGITMTATSVSNTNIIPNNFANIAWWIYILGPALGSILYLIPLTQLKYSNEERAIVEKELKERREASGEAAILD